MATRVTCKAYAWFVTESVDEVKALIDPPPVTSEYPDDYEGVKWLTYKLPSKFIDLTLEGQNGAKGRTISIAVAGIVALEALDG